MTKRSATIIEAGGKLYIRDAPESRWTEPFTDSLTWPTGVDAREWPQLVGKPCTYWQEGLYRLESGRLVALEYRGQTKPDEDLTITVPIPRPRKSAHYERGAWHSA